MRFRSSRTTGYTLLNLWADQGNCLMTVALNGAANISTSGA
jgi:hypothetical protein